MRDAAQAGQAAGTQAREAFAIPSANGSTLRLFPGDPGGDVSFGALFPGAQNGNPGDFSALFGNDTGTVIQGQNAQTRLPARTPRPETPTARCARPSTAPARICAWTPCGSRPTM